MAVSSASVCCKRPKLRRRPAEAITVGRFKYSALQISAKCSTKIQGMDQILLFLRKSGRLLMFLLSKPAKFSAVTMFMRSRCLLDVVTMFTRCGNDFVITAVLPEQTLISLRLIGADCNPEFLNCQTRRVLYDQMHSALYGYKRGLPALHQAAHFL